MTYTDKHGDVVNVGDAVQIPYFPTYADKYYEIVGILDMGDMYVITELDGDSVYVDFSTTYTVEPWKVELI